MFLLISSCLTHATAVSPSERARYQDYINSTKSDIGRDTELEFKYQEAIELMNGKRYDEALSMFDQILERDPTYRNTAKLRADLAKLKDSRIKQTVTTSVREQIRQGDAARHAGNRALAVSFYKAALAADPTNTAAQKKVQEINQELARKQFEAGYIHYNRNNLEDALDAWSEAITLDPTLKQKGLLTLMAKTEKTVRQDQVAKLAQQGYAQYNQGDLVPALESYESILRLAPRHEEARRMTAKLRYQLGQKALVQAKTSLTQKDYASAKIFADQSIAYGWDVTTAQDIKSQAEKAIHEANNPKPRVKPATTPVKATPPPDAAPAPPPPPAVVSPQDAEKAKEYYKQILNAVRIKDFHRALDSCEKARQLDPSNERIYVACERARQEWDNMKATGAPGGPL